MDLDAQNDDFGLAGFQYVLTVHGGSAFQLHVVWESLQNRSRSEIILPNWRRGTTGFYLFSKHCIDTSDAAWQQVQLSLSSEGLGFRSLPHHLSATRIHLLLMLLWLWSAFTSSLCSCGFGLHSPHHLCQAIEIFNTLSLSLYQSLRNPFLVS